MQIDLSYSQSLPLLIKQCEYVDFILVGAGGTGGFLIGAIARLMCEIEKTSSKKTSCTIVDGDVVEEKNIPRQNFQPSDIGLPKSQILALRYSLATGCKIKAITRPFNANLFRELKHWHNVTVIIGCVDNAAARKEINSCLNNSSWEQIPNTWWLDCGNHQSSGQVLLGSNHNFETERAFDNPKRPNYCTNLPSPALVHPELLQALPEELESVPVSCAELVRKSQQSLFVNQQVAAIASDYLLALTLTGGLQKFATYFHTPSGSTRSLYTEKNTLQRYSR